MRNHFTFLLLALTACTALADTVWLNNGDRITGTIAYKHNDRLLVKTRYAGTLPIRWSDVVTLETTQPIQLSINGVSEPAPGVLDIAEDGHVICKTCTQKIMPLEAVSSMRATNCAQRHRVGPRALPPRSRHDCD